MGKVTSDIYFGTNTAYMKSFTYEERKLLQTRAQFVPVVCAPIHVTAIIRHGTRFPSAKVIASMNRLLDKFDLI